MQQFFINLRRSYLILGFVFLYLPIIILIGYSFNASRMVNVWTGFSTRWYAELFNNRELLNAVWMSVRIAFSTATVAVILGCITSYVLIRYRSFRGKAFFSSMVTAPLVMPDVILGVSLLLMFVFLNQATGWPETRGSLTVWLAHVTFCTSYSAVIISSRLQEMDKTLEDAAMDLGAGPLKTFIFITMPLMFSALAAAWLLSFTLSLDDVVIASFVTGPGATTLPIAILSSIKQGVSPQINALATLIILGVSAITLVAWFFVRRSNLNSTHKGITQ
ncbi:MAG: ABC transporter permease subunit [Endozoicomonadaceae bacterium]|nr:ABC transporter permease subunit [Endozoicomonadaceae bacterium]